MCVHSSSFRPKIYPQRREKSREKSRAERLLLIGFMEMMWELKRETFPEEIDEEEEEDEEEEHIIVELM